MLIKFLKPISALKANFEGIKKTSPETSVLTNSKVTFKVLCKFFPERNVIFNNNIKETILEVHSSSLYSDFTKNRLITPCPVVTITCILK